MKNLYYQGYVIHEDIRSICYTVLGRRPNRVELRSFGTVMEAMQSVDRHVARQMSARWVDKGAARAKSRALSRPAQPALR